MRFLPRAFVAALFAPTLAAAQIGPVVGDWYGTLKTPGKPLPIVVHIQADGATTVDSPAQHAMGLGATTTVTAGKIKVALQAIPAAFEGTVAADSQSLTGVWGQNGSGLPLTLTRTAPAAATAAAPKRPQTPKPPFEYRSEAVSYVNPASGLKLAGTLTLPAGNGPHPVALLITGSGPQDRDETIFDHKPFLVIADALTKRGVAVLRVDDRGIGGSQGGDLAKATTADFATDVEAGVAFLRARKDIDPTRIGLIGHSEGGVIAPMVAAKDPKIAFIVLLAGTGVQGGKVLPTQARDMALAEGASPEAAKKQGDTVNVATLLVRMQPDMVSARAKIVMLLTGLGLPQKAAEAQADMLTSPWFEDFIKLYPAEALAQVRCPVLALNGEKDRQVSAEQNLPAIKEALTQSTDVTVTALPGLNHLFQTAKTGSVSEYAQIEETIAPVALATIVDWTVAHAVKK